MHHDPSAAALAVAELEETARREHRKFQAQSASLFTLGRAFVAALFIVSGAAKLIGYQATVDALRDSLASPAVLVPIAVGIELIGGALLLVGFKARAVSVGLIAYLVAVTVLMHSDLSNVMNRTFALANLAFVGALLMIYAHGAGALSVDRITRKG